MSNYSTYWRSEIVRKKIQTAFEELVKKDKFLLINDVNERSLTHMLAIYLKKHFRGYDIDCEYNRDGVGTDPKKISRIQQLETYDTNVRTDDDEGVTVFPDIIIHHRGKQTGLVIIEAKKTTSDINDDFRKLELYKQNLGYLFAYFIRFPVKTSLDNIDYEDLIKEIPPAD